MRQVKRKVNYRLEGSRKNVGHRESRRAMQVLAPSILQLHALPVDKARGRLTQNSSHFIQNEECHSRYRFHL
jgi:hypothetical protein